MKREKHQTCPNCEQPFPLNTEKCPHCNRLPQIDLDVYEFEEHKKKLEKKIKKHPDDQFIKDELVQLLYSQAMNLRYDDPSTSLSFFRDVLKLDPDHTEAALKTSWLCIKFAEYEEAIQVLLPVVSRSSTTLQKQRAYTNLACASIWDPRNAKYELAEEYARAGIALDGEGTNKLWENLATALKNQNRLEEARDAFQRALKLNPKSANAIERQASIERHLKIEHKKRKKEQRGSRFKIKSPREILGHRKSGDFAKV